MTRAMMAASTWTVPFMQTTRSDLTDKEMYWIFENVDECPIDADCTVFSDQNSEDGIELTKVYQYYDDNNIYFMFFDPEEQQYDFSDAKIISDIHADQDETYEYNNNGNTYTENKIINYTIMVNYGDIETSVKYITEMPSDQAVQYMNGLESYMENN